MVAPHQFGHSKVQKKKSFLTFVKNVKKARNDLVEAVKMA